MKLPFFRRNHEAAPSEVHDSKDLKPEYSKPGSVTSSAYHQDPPIESEKDVGTFNKVIRVAGVTHKNDDGVSRQKILEDIKKRRPPFNGSLSIGLKKYHYEGQPAFYITVNDVVIGSTHTEITEYILKNKSRIVSIGNLYVGGNFTDDDGDYIPYYARCKLQVRRAPSKP